MTMDIGALESPAVVIPSVRGEFYSYQCDFTPERPLYCLLKCKSNKSWAIRDVPSYFPHEVDLVFLFDGTMAVASPDAEESLRMALRQVPTIARMNRTTIARTVVTEDEFFECYEEKRPSRLIELCLSASPSDGIIPLRKGMVVSAVTSHRKHALILVREIASSTISVSACHYLA